MRLSPPKHFDLLANCVCDFFPQCSFVLRFIYFLCIFFVEFLISWALWNFLLTILLSVRYGHVVSNIRKHLAFWIELKSKMQAARKLATKVFFYSHCIRFKNKKKIFFVHKTFCSWRIYSHLVCHVCTFNYMVHNVKWCWVLCDAQTILIIFSIVFCNVAFHLSSNFSRHSIRHCLP